MKAVEEICSELDILVCEDLNVVSYKWLARHYQLPANYAKQVLFKFSETRAGNVKTTFLLGGSSRPEEGEAACDHHILKLVDSSNLEAAREQLNEITSLHVYSVAPSTQIDDDNFWQGDYKQAQAILEDITKPAYKGKEDLMQHNLISAVKFDTRIIPSGIPFKAAAPAKVAAASIIPAARLGSAPNGTAAVLQAVSTNQAATTALAAAAAPPAPASKPPSGRGSAAASSGKGQEPPIENQQAATGPSKPASASTGAAKPSTKGGSSLAKMWSKVPAKKASGSKPSGAPSEAPSGAAALAAQPSAELDEAAPVEEAGSKPDPHKRPAAEEEPALGNEGEEEDEDEEVVGRGTGRRLRRRVVHEEEEEGPDNAPPPTCAAEAAAVPNVADMDVDDGDHGSTSPKDAEAGAQDETEPATARGRKGRKASSGGRKREASTAAAAPPTKKPRSKGKQSAAAETPAEAPAEPTPAEPEPEPALVKGRKQAANSTQEPAASTAFKPGLGSNAAGVGTSIRKTVRTYYNERGEEVTEEAFEEVPAAAVEENNGGDGWVKSVEGDKSGVREEGPEQLGAKAVLGKGSAAAADAGKMVDAGKGSGGGQVKQAAAGKDAGRKTTKAAAGTRNIMSFFAKKS